MSADIRVNTDFPNHRKTKKLIQKLGYAGPTHLLFLWTAIAKSRPKGELTGMTQDDIALDGQWPGSPEVFVDALLTCGFLEMNGDGIFRLHDWETHQGFVYHSPERSQQARENVKKRWSKIRTRKKRNRTPIPTVYESYTEGNTPSPIPSPIPSPSPKKEIINIPPDLSDVKRYCEQRKNGIDPQAFCDHYQSRGWMIGKNKMKDWQAAIRTWEKNSRDNPTFSGGKLDLD